MVNNWSWDPDLDLVCIKMLDQDDAMPIHNIGQKYVFSYIATSYSVFFQIRML